MWKNGYGVLFEETHDPSAPCRRRRPGVFRRASYSTRRNARATRVLRIQGPAASATAEREVLLCRLSFVLTGLPPSAALRERFLNDARQDGSSAYEKLVGELLASPHFGERFARHWMDVVRYVNGFTLWRAAVSRAVRPTARATSSATPRSSIP